MRRSAKREGDGIGLASVATLAKRYRGEVQVEIDEAVALIVPVPDAIAGTSSTA